MAQYPNIMTDVIKSVEAQKKSEPFPDGLAGQALKIAVRHASLSIYADEMKYGKIDNKDKLKKAGIELLATTFIFLNELEKLK